MNKFGDTAKGASTLFFAGIHHMLNLTTTLANGNAPEVKAQY
jgi:hypothetical protein